MSIEHGTIVIFVVMVSGRALIFRKGKTFSCAGSMSLINISSAV